MWTATGLTTIYVLVFLHIATRRVVISGVSAHPADEWMAQVARNATGWDGELEHARFLIHDRDSKYTAQFDAIFQNAGTKIVRLPRRSPSLNAYCERFIRSIKEEVLGQLILFGERSLRYVLREYLAHYHAERNHQGRNHEVLFPDERLQHTGSRILRFKRLGGLLSFYHRDAA